MAPAIEPAMTTDEVDTCSLEVSKVQKAVDLMLDLINGQEEVDDMAADLAEFATVRLKLVQEMLANWHADAWRAAKAVAQ